MAIPFAAIGAGASALSALNGLFNSGSAAAAAQAQNDIAMRNYYLQRMMAQQQMQLATAGSTDSRGNTTRYVPGLGWVTTPTATTRGLQIASDNEERQRLTTDAIRARLVRERAAQRGIREGAAADSLLNEVTSPYQERPSDVRGLLINRNAAQANSGPAAMRKRIGMQQLRAGSGGGAALATMARNGQADRRTALAEAALDARPQTSQRRSTVQDALLNRYGALASGAKQAVDVGFNANDNKLAQLLAQRAGGAAYGSNSAGYISAPKLADTAGNLSTNLLGLGSAFTELGKSNQGTQLSDWLGGLFSSSSNNKVPNTEYTTKAWDELFKNDMSSSGGWM